MFYRFWRVLEYFKEVVVMSNYRRQKAQLATNIPPFFFNRVNPFLNLRNYILFCKEYTEIQHKEY